jgi:hypothetical protein
VNLTMAKPNLTIKDFIPLNLGLIELRQDGARPVWHYKGESLPEAITFARTCIQAGDTFFDPLTNRPFGSHLATLTAGQIRLLLAMHQAQVHDKLSSLKYPEQMPFLRKSDARGFSTNYNYLMHFGLANKKKVDGGTYWFVTTEGRQFCEGTVPTYQFLINQGSEVIRYGPKITFAKQLLPEIDTLRRNPLWWRKDD